MTQQEAITPGPLTEEELADFISPVSLGYFQRATPSDKAKILAWIPELRAMSDRDFIVECSSAILESAVAGRFRVGNYSGTHARADICHDEAKRRHQADGHGAECRGDTLYVKGYNRALKDQGHATDEPRPCTCGRQQEAEREET